ncbi:MAG: hypothetical protein IKV96_01665 [Firmicutes bacterium]|nr:hypothetical protein [Bacillota bacterium]
MIENDTIRLLRECDAGIKMGISSIDDVFDNVKDQTFKKQLKDSKSAHEKLGTEIRGMLANYSDTGKDPNPMAKGMSWIKTNAKMMMDESDQTVANLITDGCNMGVKSLSKYLNQYKAADEKSKDITKRLITVESDLARDIRGYL